MNTLLAVLLIAVQTAAVSFAEEKTGGKKMVEAISMQQWLEVHKRTLDCLRGVLDGLTEEQLLWEPPMLKGQVGERGCGEPRPFSIAGVLQHVCAAERYWLREVKIAPTFVVPAQKDWKLEVFQRTLDRIEKQYEKILAERPNDEDVLHGLGRVCQHNLSHWKQAHHLRVVQQPKWRQQGDKSWEDAVDYMTLLMIYGGKAQAK